MINQIRLHQHAVVGDRRDDQRHMIGRHQRFSLSEGSLHQLHPARGGCQRPAALRAGEIERKLLSEQHILRHLRQRVCPEIEPDRGEGRVAAVREGLGEILFPVRRAVIAVNRVIVHLQLAGAGIAETVEGMIPAVIGQRRQDFKGGSGRIQPLCRAVDQLGIG